MYVQRMVKIIPFYNFIKTYYITERKRKPDSNYVIALMSFLHGIKKQFIMSALRRTVRHDINHICFHRMCLDIRSLGLVTLSTRRADYCIFFFVFNMLTKTIGSSLLLDIFDSMSPNCSTNSVICM